MMRTPHQHDICVSSSVVTVAVGHGCEDVCFRPRNMHVVSNSFCSSPPRPCTWREAIDELCRTRLRTMLVIFRKIGRSGKRSSRRCHRSRGPLGPPRVAQARTNLCGTRTNTGLFNRLVQRQTQRNLFGLGSPLQTGARKSALDPALHWRYHHMLDPMRCEMRVLEGQVECRRRVTVTLLTC
ncbi:hypothetical protein BDZ85DRAFT_125384 [Elsinoe ampelina]|uniref:Uncharacterized protein n=1 Tax=Elsinoe ampelina TaxID=302913 RepID=A0A6A6G973_9PEZI|nr:hypothetical protein BDZ85DRAFT_125384 [Elsinoe ampelina]